MQELWTGVSCMFQTWKAHLWRFMVHLNKAFKRWPWRRRNKGNMGYTIFIEILVIYLWRKEDIYVYSINMTRWRNHGILICRLISLCVDGWGLTGAGRLRSIRRKDIYVSTWGSDNIEGDWLLNMCSPIRLLLALYIYISFLCISTIISVKKNGRIVHSWHQVMSSG
jgi:hypothetical protein